MQLSGPLDPVEFDIDADGELDLLTWTDPSAELPFLALDRNANGLIDDGFELFGSAAPQAPSAEPNGYEALKLLDTDGDGQITPADEAFSDLLLWTDRNHDGYSDAGEMVPASSRIASLDISYRISKREDQYGNLLRYWSFSDLLSGRRVHTVDVIFVRVSQHGPAVEVATWPELLDKLN